MKIKTLILSAFLALGAITVVGCGPQFIDYAHNGSCALSLDYQGHDFFTDGIGECTLKSNIDGDTAHFYSIVHGESEILKARFYGIDTPESTGNVQPYGKKASNFTKEKLNNASENGTIVISSPFFTYKKPETDSTGSRYLSLVWINETKKHAAVNELTLLNLWIVQEGLSWAKNVSEVPEFADTFQDAQNQAEKFALNLWSGPDPDYNYDEKYEDTSLLDIRNELVAKMQDSDHENAYDDVKVQFTGTVAGFADNTLYVQEKYVVDKGDGTTETKYAGINVFVGMTSISSRYTTVGAYLRVVGLCLDSEKFGFQVTDTQGHWPPSGSTDDSDCQVLITAADNIGEHALYTFEYTAAQIDALHSGSTDNYENLFCRTRVTDAMVCSRAYVNADGDATLYFKDHDITAYIPFQYYGDLDNTSDVWNTEDRFVGKTFKIEGVYANHTTTTGKTVYQIVPTKSSDILCITDTKGTVPSKPNSVIESVTLANTLDGNKKEKTDITYYTTGVIKSVTSISSSNEVTLVLNGDSNGDLTVYKAGFPAGTAADTIAEMKKNLVAGSTINVKGQLQNYEGTPEVATGGVILNVYPHGALETDPFTVDEAKAVIAELNSGADGSPRVNYFVSGQITAVSTETVSGNTRYNLTLADGLGVYQARLSGVDASDIVVGNYVLVKGRLYNDNGSPYIRGATYIVEVGK